MLIVDRAVIACCRVDLAPAGRDRNFRQSKIKNLGVPALGDKNICGLNIAVNDALRMRRIQRIGNLNARTEKNFSIRAVARQ